MMNTDCRINEFFRYAYAIREAERRYAIPEGLLARVLYRECGFEKEKIEGFRLNPLGAIGIAGLTPQIAARYKLADRLNPFASIDTAGRYLADLHRIRDHWRFAALAYKWGEKWALDLPEFIRNKARDYVEFVTAGIAV